MAIFKDGFLRGQLGNLIARKQGIQNILQTKSKGSIKQSSRMKLAASDFGTASALGAAIRHAFDDSYLQAADPKMHNRLVQQLIRVLHTDQQSPPGERRFERADNNRLLNFQFNNRVHLQDYLYFDPILKMSRKKTLTVTFPAFGATQEALFYRPSGCHSLLLKLQLISLKLPTNKCLLKQENTVKLKIFGEEIEQKAKIFEFNCLTKDSKSLLLVGLSVIYLNNINPSTYIQNSKQQPAAAIIGAYIL